MKSITCDCAVKGIVGARLRPALTLAGTEIPPYTGWLVAAALLVLPLAKAGAQNQAQSQPAAQQPAVQARPTGSIFTTNTVNSLAGDVRASKVGDVVTILVQESATATSTANTKTSKSDSTKFDGISGGLNGLLRPLGVKHDILGPMSIGGSTSSDGQGTTNRSGTLVTRISATIKEVLPNGNLRIEGTRIVQVNAEKQKVTLSGVVRPQDIGAGNTVNSVALADATIQLDGKGPVGDKQRKGLLSKIFGWLF